MVSVPNLEPNDSDPELLIGSRYGKPYNIHSNQVGFGEAYLIYGHQGRRITGTHLLNSVGNPLLPGVIFPGIRNSRSTPTSTRNGPRAWPTSRSCRIWTVTDCPSSCSPSRGPSR